MEDIDPVTFQVLMAAGAKISLLGYSAMYSFKSKPTFQRQCAPLSVGLLLQDYVVLYPRRLSSLF
jgi:hypothetical protein